MLPLVAIGMVLFGASAEARDGGHTPAITSLSPASGQIGAVVTIVGSNFTGVSSVAFNGASAGFTVNSSSRITAMVPVNATSGRVTVRTSAGAATSSASFTVSGAALSPSGPVTITTGGTYSGSWTSTGSTPSVRISTTQPVTITNSSIQNLSGGELVHADAGANVTITHSTFQGGNGRAFYGYQIKSLSIANCSIDKTSGIRFDSAQAAATISVTRNRVRNIQSGSGMTQFVQLADVTTAQTDISWNEVINTFGQSGVEDNINLYASAYAKVHDNYIQGAYPAIAGGSFSGSGIMIDYLGSHDNEVYSNQVVDTTNAGIGISGGWNNKVHNNRLVFDGKLDDGTPLAAANVGLYVWNMYNDPGWANNAAYGNTIGWVNAAGNRNDWWSPDCSGSCSNTSLAETANHAVEQAEYQAWQAKLAASGVLVGA